MTDSATIENPDGAGPDTNADDDTDDATLKTASVAARRATIGPGGGAGMPVEKSKDLPRTLRRLRQILGREAALVYVVVAMTVVAVVLNSIGPRLLGGATDLVVSALRSGRDLDDGSLRRRLGAAIAVYVSSWGLSVAAAWTLAGVVQRSMSRLRSDVEAKLHRLPLSAVDTMSRGDLLSRVTNDIDNLSQSLQQTVGQLISNVLMMVSVAVMMFSVSPLIASLALLSLPLSARLISTIGARARPRFLDQWRHTGDLNAQAEDVVTGHAIVTSFGRQEEVAARFGQVNDQLYDASFRAQFTAGLIQPVTMFVGNLQFVIVAVVGGLRIAAGAVSVGDVQALLQYIRNFSMPMSQMAAMVGTFQSGLASLERVVELLDADEMSPEPADGAPLAPVRGRIAFENVRFSYGDEPLIADLDVVAEPGDTVAIVGPTGAGKTTLVNLLMRFYELDGGRITLDGVDISTMPRAKLRSHVGMVLQDTWLFHGTIRDNLTFARPDATEDELLNAARMAFVDRFVRALPDGYDTVIDDDGGVLSVGERQLLTIARAFLTDPAILILDEATSSVDTRTEVLIQNAMSALRDNRTSFVIAHRLSTIRGADTILVMDRGRIVERGDHDELIALGGTYAGLYAAQFAGQST